MRLDMVARNEDAKKKKQLLLKEFVMVSRLSSECGRGARKRVRGGWEDKGYSLTLEKVQLLVNQ